MLRSGKFPPEMGKYWTGWGCLCQPNHQNHHQICRGFLPATSPSVLSVGRTIIFKLLHDLKQVTSDKAFQTVVVTQSSPWGQDSSGNVNLSLEDGWIMTSSSNRSTKKKSVPDWQINLKDIPFVRKIGGAMCSPNQTTCITSRCWIVKCMSHFSWQSTLMKSTYL